MKCGPTIPRSVIRWTFTALVIVALVLLAFNQAMFANELRSDQADGCERGNIVRAYLAFDNEQRITRLEQQLAEPAQVTNADARAFRDELTLRYERREALVPFPCDTLR